MTEPRRTARLGIVLLGQLGVRVDGRSVDGDLGLRGRELLAYLAIHADRDHSRERLMDILWPDKDVDRASANLRRALFLLRRGLGAAASELRVTDTTLGLDAGRVTLDVTALRALLAGPANLTSAEAVLDLYAGDLLGDAPPDWAIMERETLRMQVLEHCRASLQADRDAGWPDPARAAAAALRLLQLNPLDERVHATAIELKAGAGDVSGAMAQYELCRTLVKRHLGLSPSAEVEQALADALVREGNPGQTAGGEPAARALSPEPHPGPRLAVAHSPVPSQAVRRRGRRVNGLLRSWSLVAGLAAVIFGAAVGSWSIERRNAELRRITVEFVNEHRVASYMERLPVISGNPADIDDWFRSRVPYPVRSAHGGADFALYGGGICDVAGELAATAVYHGPGGRRVSLFVFPSGDLPMPKGERLDSVAELSAVAAAGHNIVFWQRKGMVHVAVSDVDMEELAGFATELAGKPDDPHLDTRLRDLTPLSSLSRLWAS